MIPLLELSYKSKRITMEWNSVEVDLVFPSVKKMRTFINSNEKIFELKVTEWMSRTDRTTSNVPFRILKTIKIKQTMMKCVIQRVDKRDYKIDLILN